MVRNKPVSRNAKAPPSMAPAVKKKHLPPLRAARARAILEAICNLKGDMKPSCAAVDDAFFTLAREYAGMTRGKVDTALNDLAAAGELTLDVKGGHVCVSAVVPF